MITRRTLTLAALGLAASRAQAQPAFPAKPITLIVPYSVGGPTDAVARALAEAMRVRLGQTVIVENKPGAGTSIANEFVARAAPDGYTLLLGGTSMVMNPAMGRVNYNPVKDFAPISLVLSLEMFLAVRSDVPAKNLKELVAWLKANPGKASYGSVGNGSVTHLQMELFKSLTGTHIVHIPYRGAAPAMTDLLGGQIQMVFDSLASAGQFVKTGAVRPIALAMPRRSALLPDLPTFAEAGLPTFEAVAWSGVLAPAGTPPAVIARLNQDVVAATQDPAFQKRVESIGGIVNHSTPEQYAEKIRSETEKWAALAKDRKLSVE